MVGDLDSTKETADEIIFESAEMLASRSISWLYSYQDIKGKVSPLTMPGSQPGEPDYDALMARHKLTEPGQISAITKRLINGEWHQSEECSYD
jgi:hypothetical protein